jgi:hypothetical protein
MAYPEQEHLETSHGHLVRALPLMRITTGGIPGKATGRVAAAGRF